VAGALTKAERQKDIAVGQAVPLYAIRTRAGNTDSR
jgi:hypothetical protein